VHGLSGNAGIWSSTIGALAPKYRVLSLDLRGHGGSGRTEDPADFTLDALVADVLAVVDALGLPAFTLFGHGLGGNVVQHVAVSRPGAVEAVVLVGTSARRLDPSSGWAATRRHVASVVADRGIEAGWEAYLESGLIGWEVEDLPEEITGAWRTEFVKTAPAAFVGLVRAAGELPDLTDRLRTLDVPALVVAGDDDSAFGAPEAERLAEAIPGAELCVIEGGGHSPQVSRAEEFNEHVLDFLRRRSR
jgi:aminoacrylate hydrolase